ncbi:hypothetical protein [Sulfurisoma sediminicola]|uniref:Uncharacterized protein n=1 Tax=Sulfurisoma sediminicola TaxID=1381557 RepID=A0A497X6T9_9PROT|nr:hypothetical protein [Sulfurisoma sediminicola]RLJ61232.1 hypothetical protein DFR35_2911 [Sulfurisoma sediminicola]
MIGLLILGTAAILLAAYIWLLRATARTVKRRTGSNRWAVMAVVGILVLTFGDTVFNRWYHKEVLCKRDDVGAKVFETVEVPEESWNRNFRRAEISDRNTRQTPFLRRYAVIEAYTSGGWYPLTRYQRYEYAIVDIKTERLLGRFANYEPAGGLWWTLPLGLFGENTLIGWLSSRGRSSGCFDNPNKPGPLDVIHGAFMLSKNGDAK